MFGIWIPDAAVTSLVLILALKNYDGCIYQVLKITNTFDAYISNLKISVRNKNSINALFLFPSWPNIRQLT